MSHPSTFCGYPIALAGDTPVLAPGAAGAVFGTLAAVAAVDVALARTVEPHLDALGILAQAGVAVPAGSTRGVFAAEAPGARLTARRVRRAPAPHIRRRRVSPP